MGLDRLVRPIEGAYHAVDGSVCVRASGFIRLMLKTPERFCEAFRLPEVKNLRPYTSKRSRVLDVPALAACHETLPFSLLIAA